MACCFRRVGSNHDLPVAMTVANTNPRSDGNPVTIVEQIFHDPVQKEKLLAFCNRTYNIESFKFISDFLEWKQNQTEQEANRLLKTYIAHGAEHPINVVGGYYDRISNLLQDYDTNKEPVFKEFKKCFDLVAVDLFLNYK